MRVLAFTPVLAAALALVAVSLSLAPSHRAAPKAQALAAEPGLVKLADGFYAITPPKGVDEAYVVTPVRSRAADGSVMTEIAAEEPDVDEAYVVTAPKVGGAVGRVAALVLGARE